MSGPCCRNMDNREVKQIAPDRSVAVCKVCGAKHWTIVVDPLKVGVRGTGNAPKAA